MGPKTINYVVRFNNGVCAAFSCEALDLPFSLRNFGHGGKEVSITSEEFPVANAKFKAMQTHFVVGEAVICHKKERKELSRMVVPCWRKPDSEVLESVRRFVENAANVIETRYPVKVETKVRLEKLNAKTHCRNKRS